MATTTAKTKDEVNSMDKRERLWDSLNYSYGKKGENLSKEYDKARSQADRQALSRGMQRSSYNNQVLANINENRINALNDNQSALIADYENRLGDIEQQEAEAERWEKEFNANREDAAWNKEFQNKQYEANRADTAWNQQFQTQQYADQRADTERNWNFTQQQYADQRADTQRNWDFTQQQYADQRADVAYNRAFNEQQYADQRADTAWSQNFQTQQYADQRADAERNWNFTQQQYADQRADVDYERAIQEQQYADQRSDTAWNQAFQQQQYEANRSDTAWEQDYKNRQLDAQLAQWDQQFEYTKMSDEQKIAYTTATTMLQQHIMPSDALLAASGISKEDAEAMVRGKGISGSVNPVVNIPASANGGGNGNDNTDPLQSFYDALNGANTTGTPTSTVQKTTSNSSLNQLVRGSDATTKKASNTTSTNKTSDSKTIYKLADNDVNKTRKMTNK